MQIHLWWLISMVECKLRSLNRMTTIASALPTQLSTSLLTALIRIAARSRCQAKHDRIRKFQNYITKRNDFCYIRVPSINSCITIYAHLKFGLWIPHLKWRFLKLILKPSCPLPCASHRPRHCSEGDM